MQTEIAPAQAAGIPATSLDATEAQLSDEVGSLWAVHSQVQGALRKTRQELKQIRASLAMRLHELKAVLPHPGRGGAWSSFLDSQNIPRSTADRLVRAHKKAMADGGNCATERISEPTEVAVRRYLHALWPKLRCVLTTPESVQMFIAELTRAASTMSPKADGVANV